MARILKQRHPYFEGGFACYSATVWILSQELKQRVDSDCELVGVLKEATNKKEGLE